MNTPIVSADAKARLTEAGKNYTPPVPEKYRAKEEVKDSIIELRERKASYETIRAVMPRLRPLAAANSRPKQVQKRNGAEQRNAATWMVLS